MLLFAFRILFMPFGSRSQVHLENNLLRLTLLPGGGHIAAVTLKENGVNPLWNPAWDTIDPSSYSPTAHPQFGEGVEAKLLSGITGHNLCFDLFGVPSEAEAAAGLGVHGEASALDWEVESGQGSITANVDMPLAGMQMRRRLKLDSGASHIRVEETAKNMTGIDRPVGWTQHVTLGPPFLEKGKTIFEVSATRSKVIESEFAPGAERFLTAAEFDWPWVPLASGGLGDLRETTDMEVSGGYTTHLMDPQMDDSFFVAYRPSTETLFGYVWKREDFPWLGIWEENSSRKHAPWNSRALTRGMEFGVSPFPETRRESTERGEFFGEKAFRWIAAKSEITVNYSLFLCSVPMARLGAFEQRAILNYVQQLIR